MINRLTLIVNRQGHPFIRFLNKVIKKRNCEYSNVTKKKMLILDLNFHV